MKTINYLTASLLLSLSANAQQKNEKFNVIFIISDQHKTSVTGCYGDTIVKTPNIDALAATGVKFTRMYTASPLSAPSRASLITGVYPSTHGALTHRMIISKGDKMVEVEAGKVRTGYKEGLTAFGETFKYAGYKTAAIGKMHVHGELQKGVNPDFPNGNLMGFDISDMRIYTSFPGGSYRDYNKDAYDRYREIGVYTDLRKDNQFNQKLAPTLIENEYDIFDYVVARKSNEFIESCVQKKLPFVIHVGLEKPHKPWTTVSRLYNLYDPSKMVIPETQSDWHINGKYPFVKNGTHNKLTDKNEIRNVMTAYYACVTEEDEAVGKLISKTKELGIYDKTIFVYTSDHGEHLFEHGFHEKHNMFEDAVNVPFIISCPALLPQGVTCNTLASLIDVLPTLAELTGAKTEKQWEGISLVPAIKGKKTPDRPIFSEFYQDDFVGFAKKNVPIRMRLNDKYKYVYSHGMIDQLYDVAADPNEMTNLALNPEFANLIEKYRLLTLDKWLIALNRQMKGKISKNGKNILLSWEENDQAKNYTIWRSDTPDVSKAIKINVTNELKYSIPYSGKKQYFWVTANWNLTRKGDRKENIPMITEKFPTLLPVTPMLTL